jgi:sugar phosphate isomerase/epimerase
VLAPLVRSLVATLARTPEGARITFEIAIADPVMVPFERADLAEALGNLLENATRHARHRVLIAAASAGRKISVDDDGPGIPEAMRPTVLARGGRLDQRGSAGFGLHLDAAAMTLTGEPLSEAVTACAGAIEHFHVSEPNLTIVGGGAVDHPVFASTLRSLDYSNWASIEMRAVPAGALSKVLRYVRETYGG